MNGPQPRFAVKLAVLTLTLLLAACANQATPLMPGPGTSAFLDAGDFSGTYKSKTSNVLLGGKSTYQGRMVFTNLDRSSVAAVLPSGLQLAANTSATPDVHPVILIFGNQTNTAWTFPWGSPSIGPNYQEIILLIPFVQKNGKSRWHNYTVRMYLNEFVATVLGNQYYGYQKQMAAFAITATNFNVFLQAVHMFEAQTTTIGNWVPHSMAAETMNNYSHALEIMSMPILGTLVLVPSKPYVCSYFQWKMDNAQVRSISSSHTFVQPFVAPQMIPWVAKGNLSSVADGAFELKDVEWELKFPAKPCKW